MAIMKPLRSHDWALSYSTSELKADGSEVDILQDFYLPVLSRANRYDRVAGYFRSTSLAAASQGFSAFTKAKGRARLLVGADLDAADVEAILRGDQQRLKASLNAALEDAAAWPEDVTRGVELLAWMVARNILEIRVALRVHRQSGKALAIDSRADGYVHEKWALFGDGEDWLYASGSLNESKTALMLNAENLEIHSSWEGAASARRIANKRKTFERLWNDQHPSLRVYTLPEAVRQRLIEIGDGVRRLVEVDRTEGPVATPLGADLPSPAPLEWLRFAVIRHAPYLPNGQYVGMETAPVAPWPHQRVVARRIIDRWPSNLMLCDEVGLGKTIETGLAVRSLTLAGLTKTVLIAAPASLTAQWLRELADKFYLPFQRLISGRKSFERIDLETGEAVETPSDALFGPDLQIISTGLFQRRSSKIRDEMPPFDLILVDEAHKARRRNPNQPHRTPQWGNLFKAIEDGFYPKSKALLLATATPMQINPIEALDLLRVMPHAGPLFREPDLANAYYDVLQALKTGSPPSGRELEFLRRNLLSLQRLDTEAWERLLETVVPRAERSRFLRWIEGRGSEPHARGLSRLLPTLFAGAPLSRIMLRHNRSLLEVYRERGQLQANLARRHVELKVIEFTAQEREVYELLEAYCRELAEQLGKRLSATKRRGAIGFYLNFLRQRFASSLCALRETLGRRRERIDETLGQWDQLSDGNGEPFDPEELDADDAQWAEFALKGREPADLRWELRRVEGLLAKLDDLSPLPSKTRQLLQIADHRFYAGRSRIKSFVVFTRFADTMNDLLVWLRRRLSGVPLGTFSGAGGSLYGRDGSIVPKVDRQRIKHSFIQGQIDILICTDAAAEGLNLQSADLLVNFDLPWNPMLVEQRIGRIDRIGQRYDHINVINLCYRGSVEETVYGRLLDRLEQADLFVGRQQVALLPVNEDEFAALAEGTLTEDELYALAGERCRQTQAQSMRAELEPQRLYEIYQREAERLARLQLPARLLDIWEALANSEHLKMLGCRIERFDDGEALVLNNIPGIADATLLTASRELLENGLPAGDNRVLRFASYGDPVFERLVDYVLSYPQPSSIMPVADESGRVRAFAVQNANAQAVIVDGFDAIRGLELAEAEQPSETAIADARANANTGHTKSRQRRASMAGAKQTLHACADFHRLLVMAVARQLLENEAQPHNPIQTALRNLAEFHDRASRQRIHLELTGPAIPTLRDGAMIELFELMPTPTGMVIAADPVLVQAAIALCKREAAAGKAKRETTAADVSERVERLMGDHLS